MSSNCASHETHLLKGFCLSFLDSSEFSCVLNRNVAGGWRTWNY
jgi:hypothetical protein